MKPCESLRFIVLAGTCSLFASCVDSKAPIESPEEAKPDSEAVGLWYAKQDNGTVEYYHVAAAAGELPPSVMRVVAVFHGNQGELSRPVELLAFSTSIGGSQYLNVAYIDGKDYDRVIKEGLKPELILGYFIAKYEIQDDTLTLWAMNPEAKRQAIEAGKIKGTIDRKSVFFTDTSKNIAALLAAPESDNLFVKEAARYRRLK